MSNLARQLYESQSSLDDRAHRVGGWRFLRHFAWRLAPPVTAGLGARREPVLWRLGLTRVGGAGYALHGVLGGERPV